MDNTRVALREGLRQVLNQSDQTTIWLNGPAGVGKTSIAFTVAEGMKAAKRLAATFFCSHRHTESISAIIPTIAYQLALAFPCIRDDIMRAIEIDGLLLSDANFRVEQMRELIIKPLRMLRLRRKTSYAIIIDALDECFSAEEAAGLANLFTDNLSRSGLPVIHLLFTSRPEARICTAMQVPIYEILLTTEDENTVQDVRFFLRTSLDTIRRSRPVVFSQQSGPWPSSHAFEALTSRAAGLFVYAATAINFISAPGHHPQQRLDLLLRSDSAVGENMDQIYRQIIEASENPYVHCRMLVFIIRLFRPLPLVQLQKLFVGDEQNLAMMLEAFSPMFLNPRDGSGNIEIYHDSLRGFMISLQRSKEYYVDDTLVHEELACRCLDLLMREENVTEGAFLYALHHWDFHLSMTGRRLNSKLRNLLALLTKGTMQRLVALEQRDLAVRFCCSLHRANARSSVSVLIVRKAVNNPQNG
ncbi:hypothetical protein AZE42_06721 [Rhizopogon vesiculosus]|uniref:NACHT domain-containing protein n=1 Tax=Rhizopogon vesiculosus TaxID=180088 RepID=A0A1J8Q2E8_9AGAM|nr:hypothetical protein AZE42_06721 [Rhizopogon vesiculosus]